MTLTMDEIIDLANRAFNNYEPMEGDLTVESYAKASNLVRISAYNRLEKLTRSGYFNKLVVSLGHRVTIYRPTKKLLDLQKKETKPKRRRK